MVQARLVVSTPSTGTVVGADDRLELKLDELLSCIVGDHLLVLVLESGEYLAMNRSAEPLWDGLAGGTTTAELVAGLVERYSIPASRAKKDVRAFVQSVIGTGVVDVTPAS